MTVLWRFKQPLSSLSRRHILERILTLSAEVERYFANFSMFTWVLFFHQFRNSWGNIGMGFWVETETPKSWLIMTSSWWCTPPMKCQNSTFASIAENVSQLTVESGAKRFADSGFLSTFDNCFALTPTQSY